MMNRYAHTRKIKKQLGKFVKKSSRKDELTTIETRNEN